jgi:hypothetical protein
MIFDSDSILAPKLAAREPRGQLTIRHWNQDGVRIRGSTLHENTVPPHLSSTHTTITNVATVEPSLLPITIVASSSEPEVSE